MPRSACSASSRPAFRAMRAHEEDRDRADDERDAPAVVADVGERQRDDARARSRSRPRGPASTSRTARAPSGASSITAMPATVKVVMTNARWSTCATVKISSVGATAEIAHATADPTTPTRIAAAPPAPVGERGHEERDERADAGERERDAERGVGAPNVSAIGSAELAEQRARRTTRRRPRRLPVASNMACSGVNGTGGSPITARRRFGLRAALEVGPQLGERVAARSGRRRSRIRGLKNQPKNGMSMAPLRRAVTTRARRVGRHRQHGGERRRWVRRRSGRGRDAVVGDDRAEPLDGRGACTASVGASN